MSRGWALHAQSHLLPLSGHDPDCCAGSRWDNCCCEDVEWQKAARVAELDDGREQAFYHVLVDAKDWEASWERPPVAYVAEELLHAPEVSYQEKHKAPCLIGQHRGGKYVASEL